MPVVPGSVTAEWITISGTTTSSGSPVAVVPAGAMESVVFDYFIRDDGCAGCIDQIEYGLVPGARLGCVYDGTPPPSGVSGMRTLVLTMPPVPGPQRIDLRFNFSQRYFCAEPPPGWWTGEPGDAETFAVFCVVP
jgi:hypothetical protein